MPLVAYCSGLRVENGTLIATSQIYGGKVLARGGRFQIMEGPDKFQRFVVIEFPTFEQGVACFTSPEYDRAAAFRRSGAGEVETVIVEAV